MLIFAEHRERESERARVRATEQPRETDTHRERERERITINAILFLVVYVSMYYIPNLLFFCGQLRRLPACVSPVQPFIT